MYKVETTKEQILQAAKECPQAEQVLKTLFPSVFRDDRPLCEIGCIFFRNDYQNNVYAVMRRGDNIIIGNITHNSVWSETKVLKVKDLKDPMQKTITHSEFMDLTGYRDLRKFIIIPKNFNNQFFKLADFHAKQLR